MPLDDLSGSLDSPVGLLGISAGAYFDLANVLPNRDSEAIARATVPFLLAHSNATARAREDRYHWRMMAMPFHPAEPDILSVVFLVESVMRSRGEQMIQKLLARVPLLPNSANLLYNAVLERFGDSRPDVSH